jgi:hypothetical protein
LAPTAGLIVDSVVLFFNRHGLDVGICPLVQLMPVKSHTLFPNGEFPDVGPDGFVKFIAAHAQVSPCMLEADKSGLRRLYTLCAGVGHGEASCDA